MASPNIRFHHAFENSDSIARKPELKSTTRKPFVDRSVNETPFQKNNIFPTKEPYLKEDNKIKTPKLKSPLKKYPSWLSDVCSYDDIFDNYWDILPSTKRTLRKDSNSYFYTQTPPFQRKIDTFLELPSVETIFLDEPSHYCKIEEIDEPPLPIIDDF